MVGFIRINKEQNDIYSVDIAVKNNYRNHNYGTEALIEAKGPYQNLKYDKILIRASFENNSILQCSKNAGYNTDYEEIEKCQDENVDYMVFSCTKRKILK